MGKLFEYELFGRNWIETDDPTMARTPGRIEKMFHRLGAEDQALLRRACDNVPDPREFMREHFRHFGWDAEMVEKARAFAPRPLPQPVAYFPKPWHCYENSRDKARAEGIFYCEGLVLRPSGPAIHAWNSTDGTNVIDLGYPCQHFNRYLGFVIDLEREAELVGALGWMCYHAQKQ